MSIVSGTVCIEDGNPAKTGDFDPKRKVKVELTFAVPEGGNSTDFLDLTARTADTKVRELLGRSASPAAITAAAPAPSRVDTPVEPKKATRAKKEPTDKDKLAAAAGLPVEGLDESEVPAPKPGPDDSLDDLLGDAAPAPVTDAELGKKAQEKNAALKVANGEKHDPTTIRKLIAKFAGEGKRINDIPAAKRHDFLKELDALK